MTKDGKSNSMNDQMGLSKARERHCQIYHLEGGHYAMCEQPEKLVKKLEDILQ